MSGRDYSAVREVKARLNLADLARRYMDLRRAGSRWMGLCPFHQEKSPSFSINEEEGFYYCFGCQASGDLIDFYCKINGLEFREGLEQLAQEAGVELTSYKPDPKAQQERDFRRVCTKMYDVARQFFSNQLGAPSGTACREYITQRQIAPEIVEKFELGWAPDEWQALSDELGRNGFGQDLAAEGGLLAKNDRGRMYDRFRGRFIFPIKNLSGQVIAFGGRIIGGEDAAKYINSSDSAIYKKGEHLYGLFQARRAISAQKRAMLTEGYMDVLTLHQFGYENACGVLGTALTPDQVKRLGGFCSFVDLLFDGDQAGRKAALRSSEMLLQRGMDCRVVLMPDGEDIDSLLHDKGKEGFEVLLQQAPDGLSYCLQTVADYAPRDMIQWVHTFLDSIEMPEVRSLYISRVAGVLRLNEQELRQRSVGQRPAARQSRPAYNRQQTPVKKAQPVPPSQAPTVSKNGEKFSEENLTSGEGTPLDGPVPVEPAFDDYGPELYDPAYGGEDGNPYVSGADLGGGQGSSFSNVPFSGQSSNFPSGGTQSWKGKGKGKWKGKKQQAKVPVVTGPPPRIAVSREEWLLKFLVRYPHLQNELEAHGAREILESRWAHALWEKLTQYGGDDVLAYLTGQEKDFWIRHRVVDSVPVDKEQEELREVITSLRSQLQKGQGKSLTAAMRHMQTAPDDDADMELLRTLQESLGRSNGEY